jgi:hypothetical protein
VPPSPFHRLGGSRKGSRSKSFWNGTAASKTTTPKFVVAFDFDLCLMKGHWWGKHENNALHTINPQPSDFGHDDIGGLFERLLGRAEVQVAVASFGRRDVIRKACAAVIGKAAANTIFITTPGDFDGYQDGYEMEGCKNPELLKICKDLSVKPKQIVFFDDNQPNVRNARAIGVKAIVTAPFTREHEVHIAMHLGVASLDEGLGPGGGGRRRWFDSGTSTPLSNQQPNARGPSARRSVHTWHREREEGIDGFWHIILRF